MVRRAVRNSVLRSGVSVEGVMLPAPPWIMMRGCTFVGEGCCLYSILAYIFSWLSRAVSEFGRFVGGGGRRSKRLTWRMSALADKDSGFAAPYRFLANEVLHRIGRSFGCESRSLACNSPGWCRSGRKQRLRRHQLPTRTIWLLPVGTFSAGPRL
jgi:hypothetical protein